jgi:hypothetical protein
MRSAKDRAKPAEATSPDPPVFDVLRPGDRDLLDEPSPYVASGSPSRPQDDRWQTPPVYADGRMLFDATTSRGWKGSQPPHQPLPAGAAAQG